MKDYRNCEVGLNNYDCLATPGSASSIRSTCYRCGMPACVECSALVRWNKKRIRMCADCLESEPELVTPAIRERLGLSDVETV